MRLKLLILAGIGLGSAALAASAADTIAARQQNYKQIGRAFKAINDEMKKDAPSGTALTIKSGMVAAGFDRPIDVSATRVGHVPGTHTVGFDGPSETIELTHTVRDRAVFARGALTAAKWLVGKRGWFSIRDML